MGWQQASVLAMAAGLAAGCAEPLHSLGQGSGWSIRARPVARDAPPRC